MTDRIIALCILCLVFGLPLGVAAVFTGELILDFVFFWPLFMSVLWITGAFISGFSWNATGRGGGYPAADAAGQSADFDPDPLVLTRRKMLGNHQRGAGPALRQSRSDRH